MSALILMYHDLSDGIDGISAGHMPYVLEPSVFQWQMRHIAALNCSVLRVDEWVHSRPSSRSLMITFDDGHISNYELALPILLKHKLKATLFITAGLVGKQGTMNWHQLREMREAGMEIGSHTLTHRPPSLLSDEELREELVKSREVLEQGLGSSVTSLSSPTGFFNPRMRAIADEVGYRALCFGNIGLVHERSDPLSLKRVAVKRTMTAQDFETLMTFDSSYLLRLRAKQYVRQVAKEWLGPDMYLPLRRIIIDHMTR